jgi:phenylacetate-coenzyme A ligase PaaK-like adenylate-forming protein
MSPDEYRARQLARLRRFLETQLLPFSPFYKKLLGRQFDPRQVRDFDDLADLPFTTKESIAPTSEEPQKAREIVLQPTPELIREHWPMGAKLRLAIERAWRGEAAVRDRLAAEYRPVSAFFTTGRTALPTAFILSRLDLDILEIVGKRIIQVAHIDRPDDKIISLFPYAPHLAFWQVYYTGVGGSVFTLNTGGGKVLGTDAILQAIQRIRPAFLVGIPGYIYHVLREAHAAGLDLSCVRGLALGGDQVTPGYRARVRELLEAMGAKSPRVQSVLGFTEARKCWAECPAESEGGFHTYPDLEIMELVDPDSGRPVAEGTTGELVYTSLQGRGSCVLRYRTGDLIVGGMTHVKCPGCGRTVPRIASQLERVSNKKSFQLSKLKGTLVNLSVFKDALDEDARVEEWQLVIKKRNDDPFEVDELHLNVAFNSRLDEAQRSRAATEIERRLFEFTEVRLNSLSVLPLKQLLDLLGMETQLKEKRIVDLRAAARTQTPEGGREAVKA